LSTAPQTEGRSYRLTSLDTLRGLVIVIMALDHVRENTLAGGVFDPTGDPHVSPVLFFTRWITHFCAPTFVLLAGISAGLMRTRRTPAELGTFLLTRGLWLIFVEIFLISPALTRYAFGGPPVIVMQVIWAIGACMIVLAGVQFLGARAAFCIGALIVLGHNLLDPIWPHGPVSPWWVSLHSFVITFVGHWRIIWAYPLLPWIGVMCLGFGVAPLFETSPEWHNRVLARIGVALIVVFVVLRASHVYGDPRAWQVSAEGPLRTVMSFINTTKYPPSLLYLCMTLGPAALVCAYADRLPGPVRAVLTTYGRVPFAFYVAHWYVILAAAVAIGLAQGYGYHDLFNAAGKAPAGYGFSLGGVYVVWIGVVVALYPFCRWIGAVKARRRDWWLSYV
jgi:uncharacterized membrane protein